MAAGADSIDDLDVLRHGGRIRRRQLEALDKEPLGFLGAYLGRLFDVRVHELGEPSSVNRIPVDGIELGPDAAQHRPDHIGLAATGSSVFGSH
jgi:hypothetical protein